MPSDTTVQVLLGVLGPGALAVYAFLWTALWRSVTGVLKTTRSQLLGMSNVELSAAYNTARAARLPGAVLASGAVILSALCLPTAIQILSAVSPRHAFDVSRVLFEVLTMFWVGLAAWTVLAFARVWRRAATLRKRVL
jgi:hypothetical protein